MKVPRFWNTNGLPVRLLEPLSILYRIGTTWYSSLKMRWKAPIPVICVGNLVIGGTGKTPIALSIAKLLLQRRLKPVFLTRGYGGNTYGPLQVTPLLDCASKVGDEALLLANQAVTIVAHNKIEGACLAIKVGANIIIMDDGYQNPTLYQDLSFIVVDGYYGFGNNHLLPAGPLRESIKTGFARASALVIIGMDRHNIANKVPDWLPVLSANLKLGPEISLLLGKRVVAFTGIGRPKKFFSALQERGVYLVDCYAFADHILYTERNIQTILNRAITLGATAVTTEKDAVRLPRRHLKKVVVLKATIIWSNETALDKILEPIIQLTHTFTK